MRDTKKNQTPPTRPFIHPMDLLDPQTPQYKILAAMVNFIRDDDAIAGMQALHQLLMEQLPNGQKLAVNGMHNIMAEVARLQQLPREKQFFPG